MGANVVDVGVDYVTLTAKGGGTIADLLQSAYTMGEVERSVRGDEPEPKALQGYRGTQWGRVYYGERDDGAIVRVSGDAADGFLMLLGDVAARCNCTRLDLQVTGKLEWDNQWYAQQTAQKVRSSNHRFSQGRPAHVQLTDGGPRGSTCAIGSRTSSRFIRIYDKTRERSEEVDENLWRWEVEYKPPLSPVILHELMFHVEPRQYIQSMVYAECYVKGVHIPWDVDQRIDVARIGHPPTSVERSLNWLRTMVRPTVERLIRGGYTEECISALGLGPMDESANP